MSVIPRGASLESDGGGKVSTVLVEHGPIQRSLSGHHISPPLHLHFLTEYSWWIPIGDNGHPKDIWASLSLNDFAPINYSVPQIC